MKQRSKRLLSVLLTLVMLLGMVPGVAWAAGTGTESNPVSVGTADEIKNAWTAIKDASETYYVTLTNDIDLAEALYFGVSQTSNKTMVLDLNGHSININNTNTPTGINLRNNTNSLTITDNSAGTHGTVQVAGEISGLGNLTLTKGVTLSCRGSVKVTNLNISGGTKLQVSTISNYSNIQISGENAVLEALPDLASFDINYNQNDRTITVSDGAKIANVKFIRASSVTVNDAKIIGSTTDGLDITADTISLNANADLQNVESIGDGTVTIAEHAKLAFRENSALSFKNLTSMTIAGAPISGLIGAIEFNHDYGSFLNLTACTALPLREGAYIDLNGSDAIIKIGNTLPWTGSVEVRTKGKTSCDFAQYDGTLPRNTAHFTAKFSANGNSDYTDADVVEATAEKMLSLKAMACKITRQGVDNRFASLSEAFAAAQSGETIVLLRNLGKAEHTGTIALNGGVYTLDLAGHIIYGNYGNNSDYMLFRVNQGATLNLVDNDDEKSGGVRMPDVGYLILMNNGAVNIEGGSYYGGLCGPTYKSEYPSDYTNITPVNPDAKITIREAWLSAAYENHGQPAPSTDQMSVTEMITDGFLALAPGSAVDGDFDKDNYSFDDVGNQMNTHIHRTYQQLLSVDIKKGGASLDTTVPKVGDELTADVGGATPVTYQWYRVKNNVETAIQDATSEKNTVTAKDAGCILRVKATQAPLEAGQNAIVKSDDTVAVFAVARNTTLNKDYPTLQAAFDDEALADGHRVQLLTDVTESVRFGDSGYEKTGKTVTLDLAGHTVTSKEQGSVVPTLGIITGTLRLQDTAADKTGKITHDAANAGGKYGPGVDVASGAAFILDSGEISGNVNSQSGTGGNGAVSVSGTFTMNGGSIRNNGNTADENSRGGYNCGVYVYFGGIFAMTGGKISGNQSSQPAGGVYCDGTMTMTGGEITNNTAYYGCGVWVTTSADVTFGGTAKVSGNVLTSGGQSRAENVVLQGSDENTRAKIMVSTTTPFTTGASVGVRLYTALNTANEGKGVFTRNIGSAAAQAAAKPYFFSDNTAYGVLSTVAADNAANQLKLDVVVYAKLENLSIANSTKDTRDGSGDESTYPQVGDALRANATDNSNTPSKPVTYQWYRADSKDGPYTLIEGMTEENYTATAADADKFLKVVATQSEDESGTTLTTPVTKEAVIGPVALRNAPEPFAETHPTYPTSDNGQIRKSEFVEGADAANYDNLYYSDDNGKTWKKVQTDGKTAANLPAGTYLFTYRNSDGTLPESKTATVILTATYDLLWLKLTSETEGKKANEVGATVKAVTNFGDSVPAGTSFAYQWYRVKENTDGTVTKTKLEGQTAQTYTIVADDAGCKILVEVTWTYTDGGEKTKSLSTPTPIILSETPTTYSVSGKVEKPADATDSNPAARKGVGGATVELRQGNTVIATATTDENGNYSFNNTAPNGEYNIVVTTSDGKTTKTERVTVNGANASVNVLLPYYNVSSLIVVQGNTPAVVIGSLDGLAKTESAGIGDNQSIEVKLTVEGKEDLTSTADGDLTPAQQAEKADQTAVKEKAKATTGAGTVVEFLDMGIVKATTSGVNSTYQVIRDTGTIVLNIRIPYLTEGRYQFGIYRKHVDDSNHETTIAFQNNSTHGDGTFEVGKGYLDVYATKFSTYAIGYTTTPPNNNNYTGGGGGDSSSYPVTVGQTANGTVKADRSTAYSGTRVTVTATPASGYQVGGVTVTDKNGKTVPVTRNSDGTYRFTMPESAVTVNVSFVRKTANPADTGVSKWLNTVDHILYIRGYNEKGVSTVRPDNNITRAEAAMMFYRLLKDQNVTVTTTFTDVSEGQWYAQPIGVLASLGIVGGYGDGTFQPNRTITRAEFAKIATKFATLTGGKAQFKDVSEGHWASGFIATAADYGWIGGYEDGSYRPENFMTRAAAAKIINYMLGRAADREYVLANRDTLVKYTDLTDPSVWYYFEIVEASVAHDFTVTDGVEKWK